MRLSEKKKVALVLSGGGIKAAAFHIGVCLALREKGFQFAGGTPEMVQAKYENDSLTFKIYVGSSAGSVIATFLAAGYSIDSVIDAFTRGAGLGPLSRHRSENSYLKPLSYRDIFALNLKAGHPSRIWGSLFKKKPVISGGLETILKSGFKVNGFFSARNLAKYIRNNVFPEDRFSALGVPLYIVATQLNHSRKVIFGPFEETSKTRDIKYARYARISDAVAASASLPPFFSPYAITNEQGKEIHFFDGEIRDTLSTHVAAEHGADLVIASYSIQPYHFHQEMGSLHEYGMPLIFNQALYQVVQQKIEKHIKHQQDMQSMLNAVNGYLKQAQIADEHRDKLMEILTSRTNFNPAVDYVYIHPSPHDYEMFFYDHFSLNPKILTNIVRIGFRSAMNALRPFNI